jgi:hypothetical protein
MRPVHILDRFNATATFFLALISTLQPTAAIAETPAIDRGADRWVVQAYTKSRLCPVKQKQLIAHVIGGKVSHLEGLPGSASGNLQPSGDVAINVAAFGVKGYVKGKAIGDAAAGEWTSNNAICSKGTWLAIRAIN